MRSRTYYVDRAGQIGPSARGLRGVPPLGAFPWTKLRQAQKLVRLPERYGKERVERACERSLDFELVNARRIKEIIQQGLVKEDAEQRSLEPLPSRFARPAAYFVKRRNEMEITTELKQTLKKLRLGGIFATLPERGSYAKAQKLSHGEFLELVLNDEIERGEQGRTMDGPGRWRDNVFIERLWKTVKYEEVYLKAYESITRAKKALGKFFDRYKMRRPHQGLDDRTTDNVYWATLPKAKEAV